MKKLLLSAALFAASLMTSEGFAQAPQAAPGQAKRAAYSSTASTDLMPTARANHGQTVSGVAHSTSLTGADKGAAVSAVASRGRSTTRGQNIARSERSARGKRTCSSSTGRAQAASQAGHGQQRDR